MGRPKTIIDADHAESGYWRDLWEYRGLFSFLAWRDLLVRYKQTVIGVAWAVVRPLLTIVVFSFFRAFLSDDVNINAAIVSVAVATIPWQLFSSSLSESSSSLIANSNLITKVYFPRIIIPVSTIMVCLADFLISLLILAGLMIWFGHVPGPEVFLLPLFVSLAVFASLGLGLFLAALNVKYRDFRYVVPFVIQLGLFVSPIAINSSEIYGSSSIPDLVKGLYSLNPMVAVIDGFRYCLLGTNWIVNPTGLLISLSSSFVLLIIGVWYFRKTERGFADII
jgi:lipopolysaccharide transport system permease protein